MTQDRFEHLADAYGGDIDRWPATEQATARAWFDANTGSAQALLDEAAGLDWILDAAPAVVTSPLLRDRIIAQAPKARRSIGRILVWASATGLMAACLAGVMLGARLSDRLMADPAAESITQTATAFDGSGSYFDTSTSTTGAAG